MRCALSPSPDAGYTRERSGGDQMRGSDIHTSPAPLLWIVLVDFPFS